MTQKSTIDGTKHENNLINEPFSYVKGIIEDAFRNSFEGIEEPPFNLDLIIDREFGDFATNISMLLAKTLRRPPHAIGEILRNEMLKSEHINEIRIEGPGFINIAINPDIWTNLLEFINSQKVHYGSSNCGTKINIEFVSANPTGPMHIGHVRAAIVGDIIARIHEKLGFITTREFYINDGGNQIASFAQSVRARAIQILLELQDIADDNLDYKGDYVIDIAKTAIEELGHDVIKEGFLEKLAKYSVQYSMSLIKEDLSSLGIVHDVFTSEESDVVQGGFLEKAIDVLDYAGAIHEGSLPPPIESDASTWVEGKNLLIFKSSDFGDDTDRVLRKDNGEYTYFAKDIAYHMNKIHRGHMNMVVILGEDHCGYVNRLVSATKLLKRGANLRVVLHGMVSLEKNGEEIKMSKRLGTIITANKLISLLGNNALRFAMIGRRSNTRIVIDIELLKAQKMDNALYYVNYAYARANSVIQSANIIDPEWMTKDNNVALTQEELRLAKALSEWPRKLESALNLLDPNIIHAYMIEIAEYLHSIWTSGVHNESKKLIASGKIVSYLRMKLVLAISNCLDSCADVMGINLAKRM